jgi:hypothetical protein
MHHLRQVIVPPGKNVGLQLMTISHRPVVQAITAKILEEQGVRPGDVIVSVDGQTLNECSATEAADIIVKARQRHYNETYQESESATGVGGLGANGRPRMHVPPLKLSVLRMTPLDKESSYNSQHPVDVAASLTTYDPHSKVGVLSFSMPAGMPNDRYKVDVYRYGNQLAPMMKGGSHEQDHLVRYTRTRPVLDLSQTGGRFAANKK